MKKDETIKRYILFIFSLFFSALGVAFAKRSTLGVTPITSIANVLSMRFTAISIGNWLTICCCIFIILQVLILRKKFNPVQLLQFPLSFLFGWFTDICLIPVSLIPNDIYIVKLILLIIGVFILGFGISLAVAANVIMNSGEAFVKVVADTLGKKFGNVKVVFDICCVTLSITLSIIFFGIVGADTSKETIIAAILKGTREGTVISACLTGFTVKLFSRIVNEPLNKILTKERFEND